MKVLVIGSGGREHALAWKIRQSPRVSEVICAPGNAGTATVGRNVPIPITDHGALVRFAKDEGIALTVVGPDDALAGGLVDVFQKNSLRAFGPTAAAARLESSKIFAKEFMKRHGIPTARSGQFFKSEDAHAFCQRMNYPVVIKADGLALGKGVIIAENPDAAAKAIYRIMERREFGAAGGGVVIEEFLRGQECSLHAFVDGKNFLLFPAAQDHKQAFDGDRGPNTGGMGTYSPPPIFDGAIEAHTRDEIMRRFMAGLAADGLQFQGLLFPGLMITADGPKVLEFNCRFGDPETQSLMLRLKSDLVDLLEAAIDGRLDQVRAEWDERAAVCVVMASGGYPGSYAKGREITGIEAAAALPDVVVFHAGTALKDGRVVTSGGRVLGVCALGADIREARERAYAAVGKISFDGAQWRTDIGAKALA
jgi:phosphoribosylamine--glycine ligase